MGDKSLDWLVNKFRVNTHHLLQEENVKFVFYRVQQIAIEAIIEAYKLGVKKQKKGGDN